MNDLPPLGGHIQFSVKLTKAEPQGSIFPASGDHSSSAMYTSYAPILISLNLSSFLLRPALENSSLAVLKCSLGN